VIGDPKSAVRWLELSGSARTTAAVAFGVLLAFTRSLTLPGTALVLAGGVGVWMIDPDLHDTPADTESGANLSLTSSASTASVGTARTLAVAGLIAWSSLFMSFVLWEAAAFFLGNNDAHPTFSMITDPFFAFPPTRALAGVGWLLWGWHLRAR
jgi:hypothetical protein